MKIWIFVEGPADVGGLDTLFEKWNSELKKRGHGISIIQLEGKSKYLKKIGPRAARILFDNEKDLVIGLPDLYPNEPYMGDGSLKHGNLDELKLVQERLVKNALSGIFGVNGGLLKKFMERFYATALKHDLEMLLLASVAQLRTHLKTSDRLSGQWEKPVENQNQTKPPKRIVEDLFRRYRGKSYRDTKDAPAVLRKVTNLRETIFYNSNINCPEFKAMLDWMASKIGEPAYR